MIKKKLNKRLVQRFRATCLFTGQYTTGPIFSRGITSLLSVNFKYDFLIFKDSTKNVNVACFIVYFFRHSVVRNKV